MTAPNLINPIIIVCGPEVLTRRDQLARKPSKRRGVKGRGRGKGSSSLKGKGGKVKGGKKGKGKGKDPKGKKNQNSKKDVQQEESETSPPKTRVRNKSKESKVVNGAIEPKETKKRNVDQVDPAPKQLAKRRSRSAKDAKDAENGPAGGKIEAIMDFVKRIDYEGLELDEMKFAISQELPELSRTYLNKYWTKSSCGVKCDGRDIAYFGHPKNALGTSAMKMVISIGTALQLVSLIYTIKM